MSFAFISVFGSDITLLGHDSLASSCNLPPSIGTAATEVIALCQQAIARLAAGDVDGAEAVVGPALTSRPDEPHLLLIAGSCALARGLDDRAQALFERSAALAPGFAMPLLNLRFLHRRHQRIDAARDALRRCLALTPADPAAWMNLTATYVNEGEPAVGEAVARQALAHCPHSHAIRWNLALLLLEQGTWAEGWREYRVRFDAGVVEPPLYGAKKILPSRLVSLDQILPGQTVVCRGEQGLGDEILFAGMLAAFLADVRRRGPAAGRSSASPGPADLPTRTPSTEGFRSSNGCRCCGRMPASCRSNTVTATTSCDRLPMSMASRS